ncbi:hypothetical protein [Desulfonema magnum]|uniref:LPP20 lipoprotein n=1 Tax=Desulfonema magnum TaxID=45655 RepID=A0A975BJX5_9BACT|nr:hypothetical protein [Desulfonema magnum]QTA86765.1 Uncharacterized protein dnm_027890 [Desulfonema magnum]
MKNSSILFLAIPLLVVFSISGYCDDSSDIVETKANGSINWTRGTVTASGVGTPPQRFFGRPQARALALRAAKADALRHLLEVTRGVRIDSRKAVRELGDRMMSQVSGLVKAAHIIRQEYLSDGTAEVTMEMNLRGKLAELVLPVSNGPVINATFPLSEKSVYTGLIIDAKGLGIRPAMAPKILDENGQEIYGTSVVPRECAVKQGMAGYAKSVQNASKNHRVTGKPLTVRGLKTEGPARADIIISNSDAARLKAAGSLLKKCRVMIVAD